MNSALIHYMIEINGLKIVDFQAIETHQTDKGGIIEISGKLDLITKDYLAPLLIQYIDKNNNNLVLDLRKIDFIDSSGLSLLVDCQKYLSKIDKSLYLLLGKNSQPDKILNLTQLGDNFSKFYDLQDFLKD